jgi:hypothetical protein
MRTSILIRRVTRIANLGRGTVLKGMAAFNIDAPDLTVRHVRESRPKKMRVPVGIGSRSSAPSRWRLLREFSRAERRRVIF